MSETLTKAEWQEKKKHGSERQRKAAVSVQTARIIDKLLERSQGLNGRSVEYRSNAVTASRSFEGAKDGENEAVLTDSVVNYNIGESKDTIAIGTTERPVKRLLRKDGTAKIASIAQTSSDMLDSRVGSRRYDFDSEGKQKPTETFRFGIGDTYSHKMSSDQVVRTAAPALYEVKKAIDDAEEQKERRAA